jgi:hypothetical protein
VTSSRERIAVRSNYGSTELKGVCRAQRMFHDNALSMKAGGSGVGDFTPSRSDFVYFPNRSVPSSQQFRPFTFSSCDA